MMIGSNVLVLHVPERPNSERVMFDEFVGKCWIFFMFFLILGIFLVMMFMGLFLSFMDLFGELFVYLLIIYLSI